MDLLEKHFDIAFAATDGIKRLRELILTLAMQGKLVPQDPSDQPASELLKEIEAEKKRLVKAGKIKAPKPLPRIRPEDVPYELPQGWEWVRLAELTQVITKGSSPNWQGVQYVNEGEGILFITSENVGAFELLLEKKKYVEEKFNSIEPRSILQQRDILMNIVGASIGRTAIFDLDEIANINQAVTIIRLIKNLDHDYFLKFFNSPICLSYMYDKQVDNARPNLSMGNIALFAIPLPPLAEQHRIVARIDQLMARCDELEKLRAEREQKRLGVHAAALNSLLTAQEADSFTDAWQFITRHFGELYSVRENVAELRKAILQLAVMEKLVPHNEKYSSIYVKLKEITSKIGSGATPSGGKSAYKNSGIPLIRSMNVHFGGFKKEGLAFIDEIQADKLKNVSVQKSDVLLNITGASIGRVTTAPKEMDSARVNQHVCIIRATDRVLPKFLEVYLASPVFQSFVSNNQVGATREALTKAMIEEYEIKLPSLPEQHRIVASVDQLMVLCDTLEQEIGAVSGKQTELLNSIMAQV